MKRTNNRSRRKILSTPTTQIGLRSIHGVGDLLEAFQHTSIQARNLGNALRIWKEMLTDKERPSIFIGLSGPLIAAGLGEVIRDAVEWGLVDVVVSTGAVLYQDLYRSLGYRHYMGTPTADDATLLSHSIDRIYDTYVDELKLQDTDRKISEVIEDFPPRPASSRELLEFLGRRFPSKGSILSICSRKGVPVFSPALIDSGIGTALAIHYDNNRGRKRFILDAARDNHEIVQLMLQSPKTGVVYIGGGTPKNWINDGMELAISYGGRGGGGHDYAIQITTDAPHWGGLSGSTLEEAVSWGKMAPKGRKVMVFVEASIGLPLLVGALWDQRTEWKSRRPPFFTWDGDSCTRH